MARRPSLRQQGQLPRQTVVGCLCRWIDTLIQEPQTARCQTELLVNLGSDHLAMADARRPRTVREGHIRCTHEGIVLADIERCPRTSQISSGPGLEVSYATTGLAFTNALDEEEIAAVADGVDVGRLEEIFFAGLRESNDGFAHAFGVCCQRCLTSV